MNIHTETIENKILCQSLALYVLEKHSSLGLYASIYVPYKPWEVNNYYIFLIFSIRAVYMLYFKDGIYTHMHIYTLQLLFEFNEMLKQTVSEVVATNWRMVCCEFLQVSADGLCFHEEYRALQLITKNIYHKKPAKLPFSFVEVS